MENKEKYSAQFSEFMNKASSFGKKAADGIQKGAKDISKQTQKTILEQRVKYYNPLFKENFFSNDFILPEIIQIVEESDRKKVDVCEGAIGWIKKNENVETLYIYKEFIEESGIVFVPFVKSYAIYCVDVFDKRKYIDVEDVFDRTMNEKIAELDHIAYSLGAKSFSIELAESNVDINSSNDNIFASIKGISAGVENSYSKANAKFIGGKSITYFDGERAPTLPKLKWFANDENIKNLIEMRCSGDYSIKSKMMVFKGSSSTSISRKCAVAADLILKARGTATIENKAMKEHNSQMIFEIEF